MTLNIGDLVPEIPVQDQDGNSVSFATYRGKNLVLYFYPKDSTPGCTLEGQNFRDRYSEFQSLNCEIIGVSKDSVRSHKNFCTKQNFPFPLWSDSEGKLCDAFDVFKQKSMYGRTYMGIVRSTFVIDQQGVLQHELRNIKVKGHVDQLLPLVKALI